MESVASAIRVFVTLTHHGVRLIFTLKQTKRLITSGHRAKRKDPSNHYKLEHSNRRPNKYDKGTVLVVLATKFRH
jgi:hypothetical protein